MRKESDTIYRSYYDEVKNNGRCVFTTKNEGVSDSFQRCINRKFRLLGNPVSCSVKLVEDLFIVTVESKD